MISSYPSDKYLSIVNFPIWEEYTIAQLPQFPDAGIAILKNIAFILSMPTFDDVLFPGSVIPKYQFNSSGNVLTADSQRNFRSDLITYEKAVKDFKIEQAKVCAYLKSSFSEESLLLLKNNADYLTICTDNDSFNLFKLIKRTHFCSNNFSGMSFQAKDFFSLKQSPGQRYSEFQDIFLRAFKSFKYNFEDKLVPGTLNLNTLVCVLFCQALDPIFFEFTLNSVYAKLKPGELPDLKELMTIFQDFTIQKDSMNVLEPIEKLSALSLSSTIAISSTNSSAPMCTTCNVVRTTYNSQYKKFNAQCKSCFLMSKSSKSSTRSDVKNDIVSDNMMQQAKETLAKYRGQLKKQSLLLNSSIKADTTNDVTDLDFQDPDYYNNLCLSSLFPTTALPINVIDTNFYYDSCCSNTTTSIFSMLDNPIPLINPIHMNSSTGHTMIATHKGTLKGFPFPLRIYYCKEAVHQLISLGDLVRCGGSFCISQPSGSMLILHGDVILETSPLHLNNTWRCMLLSSNNMCCSNIPLPFSKEMIIRATLCRQLHQFLSHPCKAIMKQTISHSILGKFSSLVPNDVDLMYSYFGDCSDCLEGKLHNLSVAEHSNSFPETNIGDKIYFDLQPLSSKSIHSNTQCEIFIDSASNHVSIRGSKTKTTSDILNQCFGIVSSYLAQGHTVSAFSTDCENVCRSLKYGLGFEGIDITVTVPEAHCHKVERVIQEIDSKVTAILSSLPYILPSSLILYVKKFVADGINLSFHSTQPNSSCPYEMFYQTKPTLSTLNPFLPFGSTAMIINTIGQRKTLALRHNRNINNVSKCQLAINFGIDHLHPGCFLWYTPLAPVLLPRNNFKLISCIPFNYESQSLLRLITPSIESLIPINSTVIPAVCDRPVRVPKIPSRLNLSSITTEHELYISRNHSNEFSIKKGRASIYSTAVDPAINKEITKHFINYKSLEFVDNIPSSANKYRLFAFLKNKFHKDTGLFKAMTCRICAIANPTNTYLGEKHSAYTSDHHLFLLTITAVSAYAIANNIQQHLYLRRYDIPGAFLQVPDLSLHPSYGVLPPDLPIPYAGRLVKFNAHIYGTPSANEAFFKDHDCTLKSLGFTSCILDPCKYIKIDSSFTTYKKFCIISTHVDDGGSIGTDIEGYYWTIAKLNERYGKYGLLDESIMNGYLGMNFHLHTSGAITADLSEFITTFLAKCNLDRLPSKTTPYPMNLFDDSIDLTPSDPKTYQRIVGNLIYTLLLRNDLKLAVTQAASHNISPTIGDTIKLSHLLGYLKSNPSIGPKFFTTDGVILIAGCDVAFAVHPNGASQISLSFRIGQHSAPFHVVSFAQKTCISLNPTHSEYYGLSCCVEFIETYCYYLNWLGFTQLGPTILETDSDSSIFIAEAPIFTKKSKNLLVKYANVRLAINNNLIILQHIPSSTNMNDLNCKPNVGPSFILKRDALFNN